MIVCVSFGTTVCAGYCVEASADGGTCSGADAPCVSVSGVCGASAGWLRTSVSVGGGEFGSCMSTVIRCEESCCMTVSVGAICAVDTGL